MSRHSHAGGVVVRTVDGEREYLLVEARRSRGISRLTMAFVKVDKLVTW